MPWYAWVIWTLVIGVWTSIAMLVGSIIGMAIDVSDRRDRERYGRK